MLPISDYDHRIDDLSRPWIPVGDLLALARLDWVERMGLALEAWGHTDHRRSDAGALRLLLAFDLSVGQLGRRLGVTRQAGRKLADGLVRGLRPRFERDAVRRGSGGSASRRPAGPTRPR